MQSVTELHSSSTKYTRTISFILFYLYADSARLPTVLLIDYSESPTEDGKTPFIKSTT